MGDYYIVAHILLPNYVHFYDLVVSHVVACKKCTIRIHYFVHLFSLIKFYNIKLMKTFNHFNVNVIHKIAN